MPETGRRIAADGKATEFPGGLRLRTGDLAAHQIDADWAREMTRQRFLDLDELVRQAAILSAGLWRDRDGGPTHA